MAVTAEGPTPSRWTLRTIRATISPLKGYSLSGVWRVLQRYDLGLRSGRVQLYSPDAEYAVKVERLEECLAQAARAPKTHAVVFLDEMGFYRWPDPAPTWAGQPPAPAPQAERAGTNNRQHRLIGVLNAVTGRVDYLDHYIVGRAKVIAMYERIAEVYAAYAQVYVAQDNWSIHHHADVEAALQQWPHIEPLWLPTYAPWLNPIEKLWRWLRQDVLKMHRLADDFATLQQRVRDFLNQFANGSQTLLHYVGLRGDGRLARALRLT